MKKLLLILPLVLFFSFSFLAFGLLSLREKQMPASLLTSPELLSPGNWVKQEQIEVYPDRVVLSLLNPSWATFTNTNSMDPFLDETANAIELKPSSSEQIQPGDVISYQTSYGLVIHRVVEKSQDEKGVYFRVKGDNNQFTDPFKVRFEDVKGVVVAIIY